MDANRLKELLEAVAAGAVSADDAARRLRSLPFEDMGFAKVDHHRALRKGFPEVIFGEGKTPEQVVAIMQRMAEHGSNTLATRCSVETIEAVLAAHPKAVHYAEARAVALMADPPPAMDGFTAVLCAGTSDIPVGEEAAITLECMGAPVKRIYDVGVAGIHRLFQQREIIEKATVIIVCAGMEGALPSVVAGLVDVPVLAVPTSIGYGASFNGVTAMLGMLNSCSTGLAVVNIDNGFGAGALAGLIQRQVSMARQAASAGE
jgi:hypothetical protein